MVICQYYLKGMCKFGDRCRNEHRKPDNRGSNDQGYDDHYNQGYRGHQNYDQDRKGGGGGQAGQARHGGGRQGHGNQGYDDHYDQGYRNNQNYNQDRKGGGRQGHYGGGGGDQGHDDHYNQGYRNNQNYNQDRKGEGGGGGGGGDQGHDDHYNQGYRNNQNYNQDRKGGGNQGASDGYRGGGNDKYHYDAKNTGNSNRFSALSHQPDPEMPNFDQRSQSRGRTNSSTSQHSDQNLERVVKKEIQDWTEGGQWPLSCYSPIPSDICFHGLVDISPEEVRVEAYKANAEGNSQSYVQSLQQTIEKYEYRKRELANMSLSSLQQEMSKSSQPSNTTSAGLFGGIASSPSPFGGNQTSLFGNTQAAIPTSSPELFPSSTQSTSGSGPFSSTPFASSSTKQVTFGSTLPVTNSPGPFGDTSGTVSQPLFGTSKNHPNISEAHTSSTATSADTRQPAVPLLKCSEQDMKAFKADHFVLGAIPECPPPLELC